MGKGHHHSEQSVKFQELLEDILAWLRRFFIATLSGSLGPYSPLRGSRGIRLLDRDDIWRGTESGFSPRGGSRLWNILMITSTHGWGICRYV